MTNPTLIRESPGNGSHGYLGPMREKEPQIFEAVASVLARGISTAGLTDRERHILRVRFGLDSREDWSYEDLARELGATPHRIRQSEENGVAKIRRIVEGICR